MTWVLWAIGVLATVIVLTSCAAPVYVCHSLQHEEKAYIVCHPVGAKE